MPHEEIIYIDLLRLNSDPEHQKILGNYIKNAVKKKGKLRKGKIFTFEGQKFSLSNTVDVLEQNGDTLKFIVIENNLGNRVTIGEGDQGKILQGIPLVIVTMNNEVIAKLDQSQKRAIKVKSISEDPEQKVQEKASFVDKANKMKHFPNLDVQAQAVLENQHGEERHYMDMLLIDGVPLKGVDFNRFSELEKFELILNIFECLWKIHKEGIVHSDIKPANIMFNPETLEVTFVDGDLSERIGDTSSQGGTPTYAAPEVYQHPYIANPARDIYSICLLVATDIFGAQNPLALLDIYAIANFHRKEKVSERFVNIPNLSNRRLHELLLKGVAVSADERPTAEALLSAFKPIYGALLKEKGIEFLVNAIKKNNLREAKILVKAGVVLDESNIEKIRKDKSLSLSGDMHNFFYSSICPKNTIRAAGLAAASFLGTLSSGIGISGTAIGVTAAVGAFTASGTTVALGSLAATSTSLVGTLSTAVGVHGAVAFFAGLGVLSGAALATGGLIIAAALAVTIVAGLSYMAYNCCKSRDSKKSDSCTLTQESHYSIARTAMNLPGNANDSKNSLPSSSHLRF